MASQKVSCSNLGLVQALLREFERRCTGSLSFEVTYQHLVIRLSLRLVEKVVCSDFAVADWRRGSSNHFVWVQYFADCRPASSVVICFRFFRRRILFNLVLDLRVDLVANAFEVIERNQ